MDEAPRDGTQPVDGSAEGAQPFVISPDFVAGRTAGLDSLSAIQDSSRYRRVRELSGGRIDDIEGRADRFICFEPIATEAMQAIIGGLVDQGSSFAVTQPSKAQKFEALSAEPGRMQSEAVGRINVDGVEYLVLFGEISEAETLDVLEQALVIWPYNAFEEQEVTGRVLEFEGFGVDDFEYSFDQIAVDDLRAFFREHRQTSSANYN